MKKMLSALTLVTFGICVSLVLVETSLRIIDAGDIWSKTKKANILRNFVFEYDIDDLYPSISNKVLYVRNEYGLRDTCAHPSDIAILTIGGSTTDQRYVEFSSTFQSVLENRLTKKIGYFGCVTNAGIDGHSTWGHLFAFKNWFDLIPELSPKFVLLYLGLNDADFRRSTEPLGGFDINNGRDFKNWLKQFQTIQRLLPLYRLIRQGYDNRNQAYAGHKPSKLSAVDYKVDTLNPETLALSEQNALAFKDRMLQILNYIDAMGAKPICVTQPHLYVMNVNGKKIGVENVLGDGFSGLDFDFSLRSLNKIMSEVCGEHFFNLHDNIFGPDLFYDGIHTTNKGSKYIGNKIADFMIENSLTEVLKH